MAVIILQVNGACIWTAINTMRVMVMMAIMSVHDRNGVEDISGALLALSSGEGRAGRTGGSRALPGAFPMRMVVSFVGMTIQGMVVRGRRRQVSGGLRMGMFERLRLNSAAAANGRQSDIWGREAW